LFASIFIRFYRAMHYIAKRSIEIACCPSVRLSVCDVGRLGPHRLEILETNCTDNYCPNTFALRSPRPKAIHLSHGKMDKFGETRGGVEKSGVTTTLVQMRLFCLMKNLYSSLWMTYVSGRGTQTQAIVTGVFSYYT